MLRRFHVGRFAHNGPPYGESRLLGFATNDPQNTSPTGPEAENEQGRAGKRKNAIEAMMDETRDGAILTAPTVYVPGFLDAVASDELLQEVLNRPELSEKTLATVLRKKLGHKEGENLADIDVGRLSMDERRIILVAVLEKHPELTRHLAKTVEERLRSVGRLGELMESIERKIKGVSDKKFAVIEAHRKILEHRDEQGNEKFPGENDLERLEKLAATFDSVPKERLAAVMARFEQHTNEELEISGIAKELSIPHPGESAEQKELLHFLMEVKRTYHKGWLTVAGLHQSKGFTDAQLRQRREEYQKKLEEQQAALSTYLEAQIRKEISEAEQANIAVVNRVRTEIKGSDAEIDAQETERRMLEKKGYGVDALLQSINKNILAVRELTEKTEDGKTRLAIGKDHEDFLDYAEKALGILSARKAGQSEHLETLLAGERTAQEETDEWSYGTALKVRELNKLTGTQRDAVEEVLEGTKWENLATLQKLFEPSALRIEKPEEFEKLYRNDPSVRILATDEDITHREKQSLTALLLQLKADATALVEAKNTDRQLNIQRDEFEQMRNDEVFVRISQVRSELGAVLPGLVTNDHLAHEVAKTLRVPDLLLQKKAEVEGKLTGFEEVREAVENPEPMDDPKEDAERQTRLSEQLLDMKRSLPDAQWEIDNLRKISERLTQIDAINFVKTLGADEPGYFSDGVITINDNLSADEKNVAIHHEQGHGIIWALSAAFPLMQEYLKAVRERNIRRDDQTVETFEQMLASLEEHPHYVSLKNQKATWTKNAISRLKRRGITNPEPEELEKVAKEVYREQMLNELLVRHAEWVEIDGRTTNVDPTELALFRALDEDQRRLSENSLAELRSTIAKIEQEPEEKMVTQADDGETTGIQRTTAHTDAAAETMGPGLAEADGEQINAHSELHEIQREIEIMKSFIESYPEAKPVLEASMKKANANQEVVAEEFLQIKNGSGVPEKNPKFVERVKALRKFTQKIVKGIREIDVNELDISQVERTKKPGFFENINFMSVLDIMKLAKDIGEDIHHIYQRRQDKMLKQVGVAVTDFLAFGKNTPYIGEYFEELRGYHDRRYSGTDVKAAKDWEEALKFVDSYTVANMIGTTENRDLVRGGIGLLVSRGDMDWNDTGIWHTLEHLTGYKMPTKACLRDDVLRDTWLRKLINAAWNDKEQYYSWRQGNDSAIKKNKSDFTPTADQLANVSGGLSHELRKQLMLHVKWTKEGKARGEPIPDDIKPHLYEEVLHYAMRNGKMTMEDKFFYLVQGVRHGIMSIDRLRVIAGEQGEILLRFPFIDYFYGKNNTMAEIDRLGQRMEEEGVGADKFKPGAKTMLFLQLEMAREEAFRYRLSKALGRDNMEKIDHEDYPMIIGLVDYSVVDNMTGVLSGSRFKITKESVKNSYVGFNTKFKAFGRLADMEAGDKPRARFTDFDAREIAISLTSFVHFDNLLTRKAWDGQQRQTLTENDILNTTAPSSGSMTVSVFRDRAYAFANKLLDKLEEAGFDWENGAKIGRDKFLQRKGHLNIRSDTAVQPDQRDTYSATAGFQKELERVFKTKKGKEALKEILRQQTDVQDPNARQDYLMEEGAGKGDEYLTKKKTEEYFDQLRSQERQAAAV